MAARVSLAVKYRPTTFEDLTEQGSVRDILTNQINTESFQHAYLFTGPAGTGKTTSARIFANMINKGKGNTIEIDAASNSGVDNIRQVIDDSKKKPLDADYKIFIIDECHSLSNGAWQAMLKLLEEPPKFSIFILATTDPQKIPATILSRVQRFQFNKISNEGIKNRLKVIITNEVDNLGGIDYDTDALDYIAKIVNGGMRDAITLLDKCLSLSHSLTLENVLRTIGSESYDVFMHFTEGLLNKTPDIVINTIDTIYEDGKDVKQFIKEYMKFVLEVEKYSIYADFKYICIPKTYKEWLDKCAGNKDIYKIMNMILDLHNKLKWEQDAKTLIELTLLLYCGG